MKVIWTLLCKPEVRRVFSTSWFFSNRDLNNSTSQHLSPSFLLWSYKQVGSSSYSQEEASQVRVSMMSAFLPQYVQFFTQNAFRDAWCPTWSLFFTKCPQNHFCFSLSGGFVVVWGFFCPLQNVQRVFTVKNLNPFFSKGKRAEIASCGDIVHNLILPWA